MYCVNCGVKLGDTEKYCPLCGTVVYHPDIQREKAEPLYPGSNAPAPGTTMSQVTQIIATAAFLLPMLITIQCDFRVTRGVTWSGYVIGALAVLYCLFVLPQWFRRPHPVLFGCADLTSVALYLFYINHSTGGNWFLTFALPVTCAMGLLLGLMAVLLKYWRGGAIYVIGGAIMVLGLYILGLEALLWVTFDPVRFVGWSTYPMTVLLVLGLTLILLGMNRRARERMKRKFFI